jgi:hypothetical protein
MSTDFALLKDYNKNTIQQSNISDFFFAKPKQLGEITKDLDPEEKDYEIASAAPKIEDPENEEDGFNSQGSYCEGDCPLPIASLAPKM